MGTGEAAVDLRVLGRVELRIGGRPVGIGPDKQRCLLAALALVVGRVVPDDRLADQIWGERRPGGVRSTLYTYVARLRRVLERTPPGGNPATVLRIGTGYMLALEPERVDVHRVRSLVARARGVVRGGDDRIAIELLTAALEAWHGHPLADVSGEWAARARTALVRERLGIVVEWVEAGLRLGRHTEMVEELFSIVEEHPLAEQIIGLLMRALHEIGRRSEASMVYHDYRRRLDTQLGMTPGDVLMHQHEDLLRSGARRPIRPS